MACILTSNDEFDSTESDELLEDLMPPVHDHEQMDAVNQVGTAVTNISSMASLMQATRQRDHYTKLFGLCPLPSIDNALETRTPAPLPQEFNEVRVLVKVLDLRWVWQYF